MGISSAHLRHAGSGHRFGVHQKAGIIVPQIQCAVTPTPERAYTQSTWSCMPLRRHRAWLVAVERSQVQGIQALAVAHLERGGLGLHNRPQARIGAEARGGGEGHEQRSNILRLGIVLDQSMFERVRCFMSPQQDAATGWRVVEASACCIVAGAVSRALGWLLSKMTSAWTPQWQQHNC